MEITANYVSNLFSNNYDMIFKTNALQNFSMIQWFALVKGIALPQRFAIVTMDFTDTSVKVEEYLRVLEAYVGNF
jgi:hypothetical protein